MLLKGKALLTVLGGFLDEGEIENAVLFLVGRSLFMPKAF